MSDAFFACNKIFEFFEEISRVPRISGETSKIAEYLVAFAKARGLEVIRDAADNIIIKKPASAGYELRPTVILQSHTDMVAAGSDEAISSMQRSGVKLVYDGDFLRADGTTLGGDDGVGMAYMLAILDADNIKHPSIEAVFTSNEEIGLLGAAAIDPLHLSGKLMINLDSDTEGEFIAGCAGGVRLDIKLPIERKALDGGFFKLKISGLAGGHSGTEINKGHINAIKLFGEILDGSEGVICSLDSGSADNIIANLGECTFVSSKKYEVICEILAEIREKYKIYEPNITLNFEKHEAVMPLSAGASTTVLKLLKLIPYGVVEMSSELDGAVEVSSNLGIANMSEYEFCLSVSIRSAKGAKKLALMEQIIAVSKSLGAECSVHGDYPEWEYMAVSPLRDAMLNAYRKMYGTEPRVINIHAGLECGEFAEKIEGLDCISMGPDNYDIHTDKERLSINSFVRVFEYLLKVLEDI